MASERAAVVLKPVEVLFRDGAAGELDDHQLLERFENRSGEAAQAAFAMLMERHAAMVLNTCRNLLGNEHDAQDASQATFLVLARKAGAIRNREAIGAWLHRVAVRMATRLKVAAGRRKVHETRGSEMSARRLGEPVSVAEGWPELHEEIERLPEKFRIPLVLCYLEGLTHQQAAGRLDWPVGTVESRLTRGRQKLRERLLRRGFAASAGLVASADAAGVVGVAVPSGWLEATSLIATRVAAGEAVAIVASGQVASLTRGMLRTMLISTIKLGAGACLALGLFVSGMFTVIQPGAGPKPEPILSKDMPAKDAAAKVEAEPPRRVIDVEGQVVGRDGRPVAGARLWLGFQTLDWTWPSRIPKIRAISEADGSFAFQVVDNDPEISLALRITSGWPGGFGGAQVVASAEGYAPAWTSPERGLRLELKPEEAPIEGRLITLEGKPIQGAEVRLTRLEDPANSDSLFCPLTGTHPAKRAQDRGAAALKPTDEGEYRPTMTDDDGKFQLPPIGPGRQATLAISGPGIMRQHVFVASKSFPTPSKEQQAREGVSRYGLKFEHPCNPGKSISGVVRDKATKAPIAGISVRTQIGSYLLGTTDKEGRYRLDGLPKLSSHEVIASARGTDKPYLDSRQSFDDVTGFEPIVADIEMVRGVWVRGRLIDRATNQPVQGWVAYAAMRSNPHWEQIPGFDRGMNRYSPSPHIPAMADGSFRLVALPGSGFLVAHIQYQDDRFIPAGVPAREQKGALPGSLSIQYDTVPFEVWPQHFPAVSRIEIPEDAKAFKCDLTFDSGITRECRVFDPEGNELKGTSLIGDTFRNTHNFKTLADSQFKIYGLSTDPLLLRRITLRHEARGLGLSKWVGAGDGSRLHFHLERLATLKGRLVDADGNPRKPGAASAPLQLLAIVDDPIRGAHLEFNPPIPSNLDDEGRFHFDGVVPNRPYNVQCGAAFPLRDWTPRPGEVKDLGDIRPGPEE